MCRLFIPLISGTAIFTIVSLSTICYLSCAEIVYTILTRYDNPPLFASHDVERTFLLGDAKTAREDPPFQCALFAPNSRSSSSPTKAPLALFPTFCGVYVFGSESS